MRNGFVRGMLVGTVVGAASSLLMNPRRREKAREMIDQSGGLLRSAEENLMSNNWIEKSRQLFQKEDEQLASLGGITADSGCIDQRVAFLEKRLEEIEHKGL